MSLKESEENITGSYRKGYPCYIIAEKLSKIITCSNLENRKFT